RLGIPPGTIRALARAAVLHGGAGYARILLLARVPANSSQDARPQHIGVVHGMLPIGKITKAAALVGAFPWQLQNPITNALGNLQEAFPSCGFESFHKGMSNQTGPHDNRILRCIKAAAGSEIEMVAPAVVRKSWHLVLIQPFE